MRHALVLLALLAFIPGVFVGCAHFTGKTAGQSFDDTVIASDIKTKIVKDPELKTFAIDVSAYKGAVTLSGMVPNRAAEQRLVQYAKDTKGVKSIRTNLQLASAAPPPGKAPGATMSAPAAGPGAQESTMGEGQTGEKGTTK